MSILIRRRYRATLATDLTLHVFDQHDEEDDAAERSTFIEIVDEREDGYEVETLVLEDDGVETLHKILGEIIDARENDVFCVWSGGAV